jgi:ATP-dependent protease HslVU (ClpYQ) peptidase subunit
MTCIVGLENKGTIYIGSDSAISDENAIGSLATNEKSFILNDEFILGCCGSIRTTQVLHYGFKPPIKKNDSNDMGYLVIDFVDSLREILKDKATIYSENSTETLIETGLLLGFNACLYTIDTDMQVSRCDDGYAAMGSGDMLALGALYATKHLGLKPEERIKTALEAATHHSCHVRPKFHILKLPRKSKI